MISAAMITMCTPVAASHSRGLLLTLFGVPVSSNAFRETSFCVAGDRRTGRARFPTSSFKPGSKRCNGSLVIGPPFLPFGRPKSSLHSLCRSHSKVLLAWCRSFSARIQTAPGCPTPRIGQIESQARALVHFHLYTCRWHLPVCYRDNDVRLKTSEQTNHQRDQAGLATSLHVFEHMLDVQTIGYKLRAFLRHSPQQPFPAFVDERDVIEVDNAAPLVLALMRSLPGCSQFADPRPDPALLHDPSPFRWRLRDSDLQHVDSPPIGCSLT